MTDKNESPTCDFCHESHADRHYVKGDVAYICCKCVELSRDVVGAARRERQESRLCELILCRELGGTGYDAAIKQLEEKQPDYARYLASMIESVKENDEGEE